MKTLHFLIILISVQAVQAQVGIGTASPSPNAVLDVSSTTKGLMLPRVSDTLSVRNPSAGLMIFNRKTQSPAIHDGTRWNSLATQSSASAATGADSVTYSISGGIFTAGTFGMASVSTGIANPVVVGGGGGGSQGRATFSDVLITKPVDVNSVPFVRAISSGSSASVVEIKMFKAGTSTPYYSIKVTNPRITRYDIATGNSNQLVEQISMAGTIVGFKNLVTGIGFAWDIARNVSVPY